MKSPYTIAFRICTLLLLCVGLVTGCATQKQAAIEKPKDFGKPRLLAPSQSVIGQIVRVNQKHMYVLVQCEVLPTEGQEANVYSGENNVARIQISGPHKKPFMAADILAGAPRVGDKVAVDVKQVTND